MPFQSWASRTDWHRKFSSYGAPGLPITGKETTEVQFMNYVTGPSY